MSDYRGYGPSAGEAEPKGVLEDTRSAIDTVRSRKDLDADKLVVFAQGLGAANAIVAIGEGNRAGIRAAVFEGSFSSFANLMDERHPGLGWLVLDLPCPENRISTLGVPSLFVHSPADAVVPFAHSQRLFDRAHEPKQLFSVEGGAHLETFNSEKQVNNRDFLVNFFKQALNAKLAPPKI